MDNVLRSIDRLPDKSVLKLTPVSQLLEQPAPLEWLIKGYLLPESTALLFGPPAAGKSLVCIDWAACIATGMAWQGNPVKQGLVIYLAGEGQFGIRRRLKAWSIHNKAEQALDEAPLLVSDSGVALNSSDKQKAIEAIEGAASLHGPPALIVIDTLHRNMAGDENSAQDMAAYFQTVDEFRATYQCAVMTVHHSGHNDAERSRGSSSIRAALDTELALSVKGSLRHLSCTKMKDGPPPKPMAWELRVVSLPWADVDGEPESSAVLASVDADRIERTSKPMSAAIRMALESFCAAAEQSEGEQVSCHLERWRAEFYRVHTGDNDDSKRKAFQRVRGKLCDENILRVDSDIYTLSSGTKLPPGVAEIVAARMLSPVPSGTPHHEHGQRVEAAP